MSLAFFWSYFLNLPLKWFPKTQVPQIYVLKNWPQNTKTFCHVRWFNFLEISSEVIRSGEQNSWKAYIFSILVFDLKKTQSRFKWWTRHAMDIYLFYAGKVRNLSKWWSQASLVASFACLPPCFTKHHHLSITRYYTSIPSPVCRIVIHFYLPLTDSWRVKRRPTKNDQQKFSPCSINSVTTNRTPKPPWGTWWQTHPIFPWKKWWFLEPTSDWKSHVVHPLASPADQTRTGGLGWLRMSPWGSPMEPLDLYQGVTKPFRNWRKVRIKCTQVKVRSSSSNWNKMWTTI